MGFYNPYAYTYTHTLTRMCVYICIFVVKLHLKCWLCTVNSIYFRLTNRCSCESVEGFETENASTRGWLETPSFRFIMPNALIYMCVCVYDWHISIVCLQMVWHVAASDNQQCWLWPFDTSSNQFNSTSFLPYFHSSDSQSCNFTGSAHYINTLNKFENCLLHCGLVRLYGDIDLGQQWLRLWLDSTKPLPELMLICHQRCSMAFTWEQFHNKCKWTIL